VVTVNASAAASGLMLAPWPLMFPRPYAVGAPVLALLGAGLAASAGVLVSLRAASVREAMQTLNVSILALLLVPVLVSQAVPDATMAAWVSWAAGAGTERIIWAVAGTLTIIDAALLVAAAGAFQRARLTLDERSSVYAEQDAGGGRRAGRGAVGGDGRRGGGADGGAGHAEGHGGAGKARRRRRTAMSR